MQSSFAQKFRVAKQPDLKEVIHLSNDTLFVPAGSVQYIKVGDKVYKVKVELEEVQPEPSFHILNGGVNYFNLPNTVPAVSNLKTN